MNNYGSTIVETPKYDYSGEIGEYKTSYSKVGYYDIIFREFFLIAILFMTL